MGCREKTAEMALTASKDRREQRARRERRDKEESLAPMASMAFPEPEELKEMMDRPDQWEFPAGMEQMARMGCLDREAYKDLSGPWGRKGYQA